MTRLLKTLTLLLLAAAPPLVAQKQIQVDFSTQTPGEKSQKNIQIEPASKAANEVVDEIRAHMAIDKSVFTLHATRQVENVQATISGGLKYILYNPDYLEKFLFPGKTIGLKTLFAHEIGHLWLHPEKLGEASPEKRVSMEFQADEFAAKYLARLKVTDEEMLVAVKSLPDYGDSPYHPDKTARTEAMKKAFKNERKNAKFQIADNEVGLDFLDPKMFNRWNLLNEKDNVKAMLVNQDKVKIAFDVSGRYKRNSPPKICLRPTAKGKDADSFSLDTLPGGKKGSILWDFTKDGFALNELSQTKLNVFIYNPKHLPKEPKVMAGIAWGLLGTGGAVALGKGIALQINARRDYNDYAQFRNPNEPFYTDLGLDRRELFDRADQKNLESQLWMAGGAVVSSVAIPMLVKHIRRAKRTDVSKITCD